MKQTKHNFHTEPRETKRFFDLEEVRSIPIKDVCAAFGIRVSRSNFIKLRPEERTASTKLYINKGTGVDRFHDFGTNEGGDCIQMIAVYRGCSWQDALEEVADAFGIQPVNNTEYSQRGVLNNHQWSKIGVYGDLVTKNLDFDLERFSVDSAIKYETKYRMSVNELREREPGFYIAKILRNKAFPYVYGLRNAYFMQIYSEQQFRKNLTGIVSETIPEDFAKTLDEDRQRVVAAEKLLKMALRGTDVKFSFRDYHVERDWEEMLSGKISFEVGLKNNAEIKNYARKNNVEIFYHKISADDYFATDLEEAEEIPHAAFLKGETVNLVYTADHEEQIFNRFNITKNPEERGTDQTPCDLSAKINRAESKKEDMAQMDQSSPLREVEDLGGKLHE